MSDFFPRCSCLVDYAALALTLIGLVGIIIVEHDRVTRPQIVTVAR